MKFPAELGGQDKIFPLDLPIPARDGAGVVDEIGDGVQGVSIGDRVFGLGGVTGATVLSAWAHTPATWNDVQAAGAGLASLTAMRGLDARLTGPVGGPRVTDLDSSR